MPDFIVNHFEAEVEVRLVLKLNWSQAHSIYNYMKEAIEIKEDLVLKDCPDSPTKDFLKILSAFIEDSGQFEKT